MKTVRRGVRALVRSPLRSGLLVAVLAVSVGLTLIMLTVNGAFGERLDEIRQEVGTDVTVRPAGSFGGGFFRGAFGGGGPGGAGGEADGADSSGLSATDIDGIGSIDHVAGITRTITLPYTGEGLQASITPPEGGNFPGGGEGFSFPVFVTGTDDPTALSTVGVGDAELVAGRTFNSDEAEGEVAVIGANLAEGNGLSVGDSFEMEGVTIEVVGVFTTGTQFGDNALFLPLTTAQRLFDREGEIDEAVVRAESVEYVSQVADEVRALLGEEVADVSTDQAQFAAISAPISDAESSSQIALIVAFVVSAAVILFSIGLVTRQRIKEIGILKSIGASNWHVTAQFGVETAIISVVAALVGALATFPLAQTVANGLVSDPAAPGGGGGFGGQFGGGGGPGGPGGGQFAGGGGDGFAGFGGGVLGDVDVAVSPEIFLFALGIAIGLAIVATIVPAWYVGRVKPAEVLRYE